MHKLEIGRFIRQSREQAGLKQDVLAEHVGCSGPYITMLEKGRSLPSPEMAIKLERALGLKSGRLLERVLTSRMKSLGPGTLSRAMHRADDQPVESHDQLATVPLLSASPLAISKVTQDEVEEWIGLPKPTVRGRRLYLLRVLGDGMDKAGMSDGDVVLVDAENKPRNGEVVVARIGKDTVIRRFFRTEQKVTLLPDSSNPEHKPLLFKSTAQIQLRGVVEAIYLKHLN